MRPVESPWAAFDQSEAKISLTPVAIDVAEHRDKHQAERITGVVSFDGELEPACAAPA